MLNNHYIKATIPFGELKDKVQLVVVLQNGDLRAVDVFDLLDEKENERLANAILQYKDLEPGSFGPHGYFVDYKFFWADTNGFKTEMILSLEPREDEENGENLPN